MLNSKATRKTAIHESFAFISQHRFRFPAPRALIYGEMCGQDLNLTLGAEILGTAFSVFATTTSLGSPQGNNSLAAHDGFLANANGLGAYSFNIGYNGMAFGVPNLTILNVYQILQAANKSAVNGNAWDSNFTLRNQGLSVFRLLNGEGQGF